MDDDKRAHPRFMYTEPVEYGFPELKVNGSLANNISLSGISLKVQEFVPIGSMLELQLRFGQSLKVTWVQAQVVRVREILSEDCFEIGLKFFNDVNSTKTIGEYIHASRS